MYYSTIGLLAVLILFIVNWDILHGFKVSYDKPAWNVYRGFLFAVLVYYITDILWGILESQKLVVALFVDTTIYFVAMALGISFWAEYTVAYLDEKSPFGRFLIYAGRIIALTIAIMVIVNIFVPVLFTVDESCVYHDLPIRDFMLICQILFLLTISVYAFSSMFRISETEEKHVRYRILASFGFIMALCLFVQLWFPYLPIYSIAYMLGTCLLHSFIANDERENYKIEHEENKKVNELKDRFVSILDNMPGMTFTKDAKTGVYLACNQAFAEYANKETPDGVTGLTDDEIFDADTAAHFVKDDKMALSLSTPYIFFEDVPDAAGNRRQLQTTKLKYTDTAGRLCVLGMCKDVTDMIKVQHEHDMTKEAYEQAVSSGLMYSNIAQTLAQDFIDLYYVNVDTEEFIQYRNGGENGSLSEVRRGWHFFSDCKMELAEKVYDDDRDDFLQAMKRKTLMKALSKKAAFVMTYRVITEDDPIYVNMKISRMQNDQYIIMGITNVDSEMRETMAKSEALTEALNSVERAKKINNEFISGMSHEIRSPINAIIGLQTLAVKNENMDDKTHEYLDKIGESANNLLEIINNILDMSQIEAGRVVLQKEEFSFSGMLEKINDRVVPQCNDKGLSYECRILNQVDSTYYGDDVKLRKLLINILETAVNVTDAPGNIALNIEKTVEFEGQSTLRFCITNTGSGMNKESADDININMAISKKLVEVMNGTISMESDKDVGTKTFVTLTLKNSSDENRDLEKKIDLDSIKVLIVDDNPIEAEHAKMVLDEVGIKSDACTSGQEALRKMEIQHAKHKPYNLVFMDWIMSGMTGPETSSEIMKLFKNECTVVALTANNWDDIREEAESVGVDNFLAKPLFASNVLEKIDQIARRSNMNIFKEKDRAKLAGRRILLAEDVDINAEIMMDALEIENIKIDHAANGIIAVEMFEKSTAGVYAAIIMDVRMPQMDGLEAAKTIRAMDREDAKRIPIIALTANAFDEDVQRSMQAGMNAHLSKPVEIDNLLRILGELIYEAEEVYDVL